MKLKRGWYPRRQMDKRRVESRWRKGIFLDNQAGKCYTSYQMRQGTENGAV